MMPEDEHLQEPDDECDAFRKEEEDEFEEFEELEDEDDDEDDIDWEDEEEKDPKNPLGLKVDDKKPIPVRKPKSGGGGGVPGIEKNLDDPDREKKMRLNRLESAKRYESLRLFEDAIKYYTMAGELEEAERVRGIMEDLYLKKAREFEATGRMDEAAHLYDILKMKDDAARCRSQSAIPKLNVEDDDEPSAGAISAFTPMNNPNLILTDPTQSPYIAAGQEEAVKEMPMKKPKEKPKAFAFCPYCGEEINLPKPPKFCPYCREPFT